MDGLKDWFAAHWKKLVPVAALLLGAFAGVKFSVKDGPPGTQPEIIIVVPSDDATPPGPPLAMAANPVAGGALFHRDFYPLARVYAAREQAKLDNSKFLPAFAKVRKVKDSDIAAAAIQAGITPQKIGDGSIFQWFTDHQDEIVAFIKIIMSMIAMFAVKAMPILAWLC